jgi:hypothetical protein
MKRLLYFLATLTLLTVPQLFSEAALAASASVSLSPSASSVAKGSTVSVGVYENSGSEPVNAVKVIATYPADKFSYVSITNSNAFSVAAFSSGGSGTVNIQRGALSPVTGRQLVATFRLKALVDSGTGSLGVDSAGTTVVSANTFASIPATYSGATITLKPVPPPAPEAPTPPADTTAPAITDVKVSEITKTSATVTWTTSEPASSEVDYGLTQAYGLSAVDSNLVTAHKVLLNSPLITPGASYHALVKSSDAAGNAASSPDTTFQTEGLSLTVVVTDPNGNPVAGAVVAFGDITATTDKDGKATLTGLSPGTQSGTITYQNNGTPIKASLSLDPNSPAQQLSFKIKKTASKSPVAPIALLIVLIALAVFLFKGGKGGGPGGPWKDKLNKIKQFKKPKSSNTTTTAIKPAPEKASKQQAGPNIVSPTSSGNNPAA